ncbi:MAG: DUF5671 domain-containing protein, partial [bacterium]|nr:DUF5671 domain-containing protein [bacterium]
MNSENQNLVKFISESRVQGNSDEAIKTQLVSSGWPEAEVNQALGDAQSVGLAPTYKQTQQPSLASNFGMWVVFEYVLMFITLAFSAAGLVGILHRLVDNELSPITAVGSSSIYSLSNYNDYLLTTYIASLIIAFPIFVFLALRLRSTLLKNPEVRKIKTRKIFIYIALTWTFLVLLSRFIRTVYDFLNGEGQALNIILHLVVTLLVSGAIFLYFSF